MEGRRRRRRFRQALLRCVLGEAIEMETLALNRTQLFFQHSIQRLERNGYTERKEEETVLFFCSFCSFCSFFLFFFFFFFFVIERKQRTEVSTSPTTKKGDALELLLADGTKTIESLSGLTLEEFWRFYKGTEKAIESPRRRKQSLLARNPPKKKGLLQTQ